MIAIKKEGGEMSGLIMDPSKLAKEIRKFYSVQEYADDALAALIAEALCIPDGHKVVIGIEYEEDFE